MLAASRFEGGAWVRVGFLVTYAAFAYGCVVVALAAMKVRQLRLVRPSGLAAIAAVLAVAALVALSRPAIRFPNETLNGFRGLDLLSASIAVMLAVVIVIAAFSDGLDGVRLPAALCLTGVFAGNVLIQQFTTRGTSLELGLWWAAGLGGATTLASLAAAGVRGRREVHR